MPLPYNDTKRRTNSPTYCFHHVASSDRLVIRCDETWTRFVQDWFHIVGQAVGGFPQYSIRITKHSDKTMIYGDVLEIAVDLQNCMEETQTRSRPASSPHC